MCWLRHRWHVLTRATLRADDSYTYVFPPEHPAIKPLGTFVSWGTPREDKVCLDCGTVEMGLQKAIQLMIDEQALLAKRVASYPAYVKMFWQARK